MTLEEPARALLSGAFPTMSPTQERAAGRRARAVSIRSVFGHIVPDYPRLLRQGAARHPAPRPRRSGPTPQTPRRSPSSTRWSIALEAVMDYAARLADALRAARPRAAPIPPAPPSCAQMAANLRQAPAGPAQTFWQALQAVWLLHMIFHSTMNGNAMGRLDQYAWPYLEADLDAGRIDAGAGRRAGGLLLPEVQRARQDHRRAAPRGARSRRSSTSTTRTRHYTSSQLGTERDRLDATNHWLQNIVVGGLTPEGEDGTNPLTYLLLESYRRNQMTNPLLTVRLHRGTPEALVRYACEVLKDGGGMPALFNDEAAHPRPGAHGHPHARRARLHQRRLLGGHHPRPHGFPLPAPEPDALPGVGAQPRALARSTARQQGLDTGDPRAFATFEQVWQAFLAQLDAMVGATVAQHVVETRRRPQHHRAGAAAERPDRRRHRARAAT